MASMTRVRFAGLLLASVGFVGALALQGACSDGDPSGIGSDPGSGGDGDGDASTLPPGATDEAVQALGKWCMDEQLRLTEEWAKDPSQPMPTFDHEFSKELVKAAPSVYASGATDISLSPSRCTRFLVTREGNRVVSEMLVRAPFEVTYDPQTAQPTYHPAAVSRWTYTADGETFTGDYDGDGFDEARMRVSYEKEAVRETHAPSNDAVLERTTATVAPGGGVIEVKHEALVDGALRVTRSVVAPLLQQTCNPPQKKPPPPAPPNGVYDGPTRNCTDAERTALADLISTGLQKGSGCLFAAGMQAESDLVLKTYIRNDARIDCTDDEKQDFWAANETGYMNFFPGKVRLIFHSKLFSQPQAFQEGTVGHELFHFFDVHDKDLEAAAGEEELRRSDPVYACEYLCFGSKPNTCHLAACMQKKIGTGWHGKSCPGDIDGQARYKIEKARGDGVSIESCNSGHQVGALCRSKSNGTEVQFCTTEAECVQECGGSCESKSLSCLPDCR